MNAFWVATVWIAVGELGDKTQLPSLILAAHQRTTK
jgi:putative Ca2+/H+ antiporter (TMEM165/GDT1 family)